MNRQSLFVIIIIDSNIFMLFRQAEEATVACGLGLAAGEGKLGGAGQGLEWVA